jgi:hypothetical protein
MVYSPAQHKNTVRFTLSRSIIKYIWLFKKMQHPMWMSNLYKRVVGLTLFIPMLLPAQERLIPLKVSVFNEATALPYTRFFILPVHPGILAGTEFTYNRKEHSTFFQTASVCYFYHRNLAQGIGLITELGYAYRLNNGFTFSALLGAGYMHTFATAREFTFTNGQYKKKTDKGNARLCPSFTLSVGYRLKKSVDNSPELFMSYQSWGEYPYSPGFIPVMAHISLHIGTKFFIRYPRAKK